MLDRIEMNRRAMLKLSAAGVLGTSVSGWFDVLAGRAAEGEKQGTKTKSCILLFMNGGPAQSHTFDLKEKSEYKAIDTTVPGIKISEYLPKIAKQMQHMSIVRSMSTGEASHPRGKYLMHTGYRQGAGGVVYPSLGALVSNELGNPDSELPNFVAVGGAPGAGYLGPRHQPVIVNDPARGLENLRPAVELNELDERAALIDELDRSFLKGYGAQQVEAHQKGYQRAVTLMHSAKARAFDISREPGSVKSAYGSSKFGEGCMLARRLIESGVKFVEVSLGGWDTHGGAATPVKRLSQQLDPAMAALVNDLKERGLLDSTLVIWMGEFGRSPGRGTNHYARAWSTVFAGGGIKPGQVIGSTDKGGGTVAANPVNTAAFFTTVLQALGIDPTKNLTSKGGRPHKIVDKGGKVVKELLG